MVRYLKGTRDYRLTYGSTPEGLVGYSDASCGTMEIEWRSMSGNAILIGGGAVSWSSKKQKTVAQSTAEAEYIAMAHATKEILWMRMFLTEVFRPLTQASPLLADNRSAIIMAHHDTFHPRAKHIALPYHLIRDHVEKGNIDLSWISTHENIADIFTKSLDGRKTKYFGFGLGLRA